MGHDFQVSRQCYTISQNVGNLTDILFSATEHGFDMNPRDHRGPKLAPNGTRMEIAPGLRLHKHALPEDIRMSANITTFKTKLKTHSLK